MSIKGEVMIEQATAMIYRSCFAEGRQVSRSINQKKKNVRLGILTKQCYKTAFVRDCRTAS